VSLQELSQVRASHDIRRFRTTVVAHGSPGRIVALCPGQTNPTYTVEFSPRGVSGATVVLAGLNDRDVGISSDARDEPARATVLTGRWQYLANRVASGCSPLAPNR